MEFGICNLNSVAIRKEPVDTSEMVSQILFGEIFKIIDSENQWIKIILDFDQYEGWVPVNQVLTISLGASLPFFKNNTFKLGENAFDFDGMTISGKSNKSNLVNTAYMYLNAPFLWGGKTPFGLDCSGFTQMVYKINGYSLLRDAHQQASQGEVLSFIEESDPGDLAFFDNEEGEIIHVGIILANNHIIHCHGKVRIDRLDQSGIYNVNTNRHTHKLRVMKQIF